jgi:hypothetical protein
MKTTERSDLIAYKGLRHAPENELGVVLLFGKIHRDLGFPEIDVIHPSFPDCWAYQRTRRGTRRVWIEFEFRSRSFKAHTGQLRALNPRRGVIVCWENDWPDAERFADVIELKTAVGFGKRVWIQCTGPKYQGGLDYAPARAKRDWEWTVSNRARPGDIVLMYRSGTRADARREEVDETRLQSIANIFEVKSIPRADKDWGRSAQVGQLARLREPLRLQHLKEDMFLKNVGWMRARLQGRPEVTAHWWRLQQLILQMNPALRKNRKFMSACELSSNT